MNYTFRVPLLVYSTKVTPVTNHIGETVFGLARWHKSYFSLTKRYNFKVIDTNNRTIVSAEMRDKHFKNPSWDITYGESLENRIEMWCKTKSPTHPRYYFYFSGFNYKIIKNTGDKKTFIYNQDDKEIAQYTYSYKGLNFITPLYEMTTTNKLDIPVEVLICLLRCYDTSSRSI
ncbi:tubby C-terminal domain-like protein [Alkalicoccobacillus murimartini]|uniref:Tubby C-terminal domain-containing protein n=1 Tax=Alkalicoccobacillus murimartini TaxID=171685 RepID=A0ABT9YIJ0_9BACI|nr:hypothetical protein [Alkalicoccobacillus murimartini]MDQ0207504.1 hypothetical protein [Alkalicoccobacillus murimartini]